jgi:hypothetical protein
LAEVLPGYQLAVSALQIPAAAALDAGSSSVRAAAAVPLFVAEAPAIQVLLQIATPAVMLAWNPTAGHPSRCLPELL